jgi:hypothetical protein
LLRVHAVPERVDEGGIVTLQMNGAPGRGRRVIFEIWYPDKKVQRSLGATDARGAASLRLRVPRALPRGRAIVVRSRVTEQVGGRALVGWTSFRVVPVAARQSHGANAPPLPITHCRPAAPVDGARGERPCGASGG